jgi:uncharacterized membrane protein
MAGDDSDVPGSARENLDVLRRFEDAEENEASAVQLAIERASRFFGSPAYFGGVVVFAAGWIAVDTLGRALGWQHMEDPPFFWLQGLVSLNALLLTIAVLIRQNRMSELAEHRAHLDLQINLLTEEKVAKILEILSRTGMSTEGSTPEVQADLTRPVDPAALLDAIKQSAEED